MGQVMVRPLAETYWLLEDEDMFERSRECQECYQNSVLFSQFLLTLCYTNNFTLLLFNLLTISDHQ